MNQGSVNIHSRLRTKRLTNYNLKSYNNNGMSRRKITAGLIALNAIFILGVASFVLSTQSSNAVEINSQKAIAANNPVAPLDDVSSTDVAVNIARSANLEEATAVTNKADSEKAEMAITESNEAVAAKPQIVATDTKSRRDIKQHKVAEGETVSALAAKFGVTAESIKWSNNINSESIPAGTNTVVPPVNGVVHTVRPGETPEQLAQRYQADKDRIVSFNDAEINGLPVGEKIVVPDGKIQAPPPPPASMVRVATSGFRAGSVAGSGYSGSRYNGYDYGYCTWYVANRRSIPSNWGNANTWDERSRAAGYTVSKEPIPGSIMQTDVAPWGHVAYVEQVFPDGSIRISEMNARGWNVLSSQTLSPAAYKSAGTDFIY